MLPRNLGKTWRCCISTWPPAQWVCESCCITILSPKVHRLVCTNFVQCHLREFVKCRIAFLRTNRQGLLATNEAPTKPPNKFQFNPDRVNWVLGFEFLQELAIQAELCCAWHILSTFRTSPLKFAARISVVAGHDSRLCQHGAMMRQVKSKKRKSHVCPCHVLVPLH